MSRYLEITCVGCSAVDDVLRSQSYVLQAEHQAWHSLAYAKLAVGAAHVGNRQSAPAALWVDAAAASTRGDGHEHAARALSAPGAASAQETLHPGRGPVLPRSGCTRAPQQVREGTQRE